jgi:hypothetical protein
MIGAQRYVDSEFYDVTTAEQVYFVRSFYNLVYTVVIEDDSARNGILLSRSSLVKIWSTGGLKSR